jgi:hypothetical protein
MDLLRDRCEVLRHRVGEGEAGHSSPAYVNNWRRELRAMEWALARLDGDVSDAK